MPSRISSRRSRTASRPFHGWSLVPYFCSPIAALFSIILMISGKAWLYRSASRSGINSSSFLSGKGWRKAQLFLSCRHSRPRWLLQDERIHWAVPGHDDRSRCPIPVSEVFLVGLSRSENHSVSDFELDFAALFGLGSPPSLSQRGLSQQRSRRAMQQPSEQQS